ncbi:MAG: helix-turn-helix transcriptional regulator [Corynebacterium sp.]|nr:helix-turn-helix transcriptional regulator [Corynebacterium sp.]
MSDINSWIDRTTNSASDREIARKIDLSQSTLSRQRRDDTVTADTAVKIARAYHVSAIPALIALDIIADSDIETFFSEAQFENVSDIQLATEVLRRMKTGQAKIMDQPISEIERKVSTLESHRERLRRDEPDEIDHDVIIAGINAGTEKYAAQKTTPPLEEHFT